MSLRTVNESLLHDREEVNRLNQALRVTLSEKCHECDQLERKHSLQSESLILRKD